MTQRLSRGYYDELIGSLKETVIGCENKIELYKNKIEQAKDNDLNIEEYKTELKMATMSFDYISRILSDITAESLQLKSLHNIKGNPTCLQ